MATDIEQVMMFEPEPVGQLTLPGIKPKRKRKCSVCGKEGVKLYRCSQCFKLACDDCGGEDEDWFCNPCWNGENDDD